MAENSENNVEVHPAKVLVVDERESSRNLLKRRLAVSGYEVIPAGDLEQAKQQLAKGNIDVIFLNMFINGVSSYDFLISLKQDKAYQGIPVIMISSESDTELVVRCIEVGAEDYLVRPLNQTLLRARLANCVARKIAHDKEISYLSKIEPGQKQIVAQEKMASLGVLMSSVSQELKNPLNFVINFAGVTVEICDELVKKVEENKNNISGNIYGYLYDTLLKFQSNAKKINEYGQSADKIIRFMLTQSSTSDGKKHPGNLNKVVQQTVGMVLSSYKNSGITTLPKIETFLDESIHHIQMSVQAINKAIYNILDNAIYFTIQKYKDISDAEITIKTKDLGDKLAVIIRDNGPGISNEIKDKVFNAFFTTKPEGAGAGLGLSTAREVAEDHRGTITFSTQPGEFTEFTMTIQKQV